MIRGSTVNQTVPAVANHADDPSQERVMRLFMKSQAKPNNIGFIETHGTGTSLGDPIEVGALNQVFNQNRPIDDPLYLGAVKANMGHLEASAGIAGLIKLR